jgi:hypothetical protein
MKAITMTLALVGFMGTTAYAKTDQFTQYFNANATAKKLGLSEEVEGVKTSIQLISCTPLIVDDYSGTYGICNFWANGFQLNAVYSTIVAPKDYGFAEAVQVGNFLD